uniref:Uncharacterized protein n=1 Tax=Clytia hemisphaerica TaxID=252671 RepID=A0A7M5XC61_9CNID
MMSASQTKQTSCKFSAYHPVIPKNYTPAWKQDMKNRTLITENAKLANIEYNGTQSTLYLEKRERVVPSEPIRDTKALGTSTEGFIPPMHSSLSKYQSSLMFRTSHGI